MRRPPSGVMAKTVSSWLFVLIASCTKVAFGRCFRLGRRWSASPRTHGACNDNNLKKRQILERPIKHGLLRVDAAF